VIRPTLILAALAALCAPPAADAAFYRAKDSTLACASLSDMQEVIRLALADDDAAYKQFTVARLRSGACVFPAEGSALIVEEVRGDYARISIAADPRPLWAFVGGIDWSAR
jgi:hypothetical protein